MKKVLTVLVVSLVMFLSFGLKVLALDPYTNTIDLNNYTWSYIQIGFGNYAMQLHIELHYENEAKYSNVQVYVPGRGLSNDYIYNSETQFNDVTIEDVDDNELFTSPLDEYINIYDGGTVGIILSSFPTAKNIYLTISQSRTDVVAGQQFVDNWGAVASLTFTDLPYMEVYYTNPFNGFFMEHYKIVDRYFTPIEISKITVVTNYRFIEWRTITNVKYNFGDPILDEYLQDSRVPNKTIFELVAVYLQIADTLTPTEPPEQTTVIGEIMAMFQGDNPTGYSIVYLFATILIAIVFLFKKWALLGFALIHFVLTIVLWVTGLIQMYVIIPIMLIYVITVFDTVKRAKGEVIQNE